MLKIFTIIALFGFVKGFTFNTQYDVIEKVYLPNEEEKKAKNLKVYGSFPTSNFDNYFSIFSIYDVSNLLCNPIDSSFFNVKQRFELELSFFNEKDTWYFAPNLAFYPVGLEFDEFFSFYCGFKCFFGLGFKEESGSFVDNFSNIHNDKTRYVKAEHALTEAIVSSYFDAIGGVGLSYIASFNLELCQVNVGFDSMVTTNSQQLNVVYISVSKELI